MLGLQPVADKKCPDLQYPSLYHVAEEIGAGDPRGDVRSNAIILKKLYFEFAS